MRLVDASNLVIEELLVMDRDYVDEFASGVRKVMNAIRRLPVVNAKEVVECKNCKHYVWDEFDGCYCCIQIGRFVKPDFWCAYGNKKKEGA